MSETLRVPREPSREVWLPKGNISLPGTPTPVSSDPTCHRYLQFTLASDIPFSVCHYLGKFEVGLDLQSSRFGYKLYFLVCGVQ
jgi:hypothetical protein